MTPEPTFTLTDHETRQFKPTSRYVVMAATSLVVGMLLLWQLLVPLRNGLPISTQDLLSGEGLFTLSSIVLALYFARQAATRVVVTQQALTRTMPLSPPHTVELRQLMSVSESGRAGNALILLYHPRRRDGLLDLDDVRSLSLPALREQEALHAFLEAHVPT